MPRVWVCLACAVLSLLRAAPVARAAVCLIDPCCSSASSAGGVLLVCPAGDGPTLSSIGATVSITVLTCYCGEPLPGIPAEDFWIQQSSGPQPLCGYHLSSNADAASDANGQTTISGSIAAGGYFPDDLHVVAQGMMIGVGCGTDNAAIPLVLVSPDITGDLVVDIVDLAIFAEAFSDGTVDPRMDFSGDGQIDVVDLSLFALHLHHQCE